VNIALIRISRYNLIRIIKEAVVMKVGINMKKVAVIGAGASGIVAALKASENNDVILLDGNDKCGKKILLTGNGRCNYWNDDICLDRYETDDMNKLKEILSEKNKTDTLDFLDSLGIYPKIKNGYYYPYSNQAASIREIFQREIKKRKIDFRTGVKVKDITKRNDEFMIVSENNEVIKADKVVIATGSKAYPKTGSDGLGYEFAKKFGHKVNPVTPALTQLIGSGKFFKDWENIRCDAKVSLVVNGKKLKEDSGEIQLTDKGISGICTFNISGLASKNLAFGNKVEVMINFLPHLDNLYDRINNRAEKMKDKTVEELFESIFNYKLMFVLLKSANISKDSKWYELSETGKRMLCDKIENFKLDITGTGDYDKAQVCSGGIALSEINPCNFESEIVPSLFFTGEILDVDGKCGGFNLAFAWISGYLAGRGV